MEQILDEIAKIAATPGFITNLSDSNVLRRTRSEGYGEMTPLFAAWFISTFNLNPETTFIDIGSGVGQLLVYVAAITGATAIGYEQNASLGTVAKNNIDATMHLTMGRAVSFIADATRLPLPWPDVPQKPTRLIIFMNNLLFGNELTTKILDAVFASGHMSPGTRIVLTTPIIWTITGGIAKFFQYVDMMPIIRLTPKYVANWTETEFGMIEYTVRTNFISDNDFPAYQRRFRDEYKKLIKARPQHMGEE